MSSPSSAPSAAIPRRSQIAVTWGAALVLVCAAVAGFDLPNVSAQGGFLDELFGDGFGRGYYVEPLSHGRRYGAAQAQRPKRHARQQLVRRLAHRAPAREQKPQLVNLRRRTPLSGSRAVRSAVSLADAAAQAAPQGLARRSLCVRACDGYFFPVGNFSSASQMKAHQATCGKLCPGAETKLYVLPAGSDNIDEAKAAQGGGLYADLKASINPADQKTKVCSCQAASAETGDASAYLKDFTLRPGDTVVTPQGMRVVRSGSRYPFKAGDFLSLAETRDVPRSTRRALAAIERAMRVPHGRFRIEQATMGPEPRRGWRRGGDLRGEIAPQRGVASAAVAN